MEGWDHCTPVIKVMDSMTLGSMAIQQRTRVRKLLKHFELGRIRSGEVLISLGNNRKKLQDVQADKRLTLSQFWQWICPKMRQQQCHDMRKLVVAISINTSFWTVPDWPKRKPWWRLEATQAVTHGAIFPLIPSIAAQCLSNRQWVPFFRLWYVAGQELSPGLPVHS